MRNRTLVGGRNTKRGRREGKEEKKKLGMKKKKKLHSSYLFPAFANFVAKSLLVRVCTAV
jgi:hypothetical protein